MHRYEEGFGLAHRRQKWVGKVTVLLLCATAAAAAADPRIAVIGSGIGGASFTRYVLEALPNAQLTVFEKAEQVGGRVQHSDDQIEIGASMAIEQNKLMREMVESLGLERRMADQRPGRGSGKLAILSGGTTVNRSPGERGLAFLEPDSKAAAALSMLWRWGLLSFYRLRSQGQALIDAFEQIYAAFDEKRNFRSPSGRVFTPLTPSEPHFKPISTPFQPHFNPIVGLWREADMEAWSSINCSEAMRRVLGSEGSGGDLLVARELVSGLMRNNYGQEPHCKPISTPLKPHCKPILTSFNP